MSSFFEDVAFPWVVKIEAGYQCDPRDTGNWTGGKVGQGKLVGTKYGISAASYPEEDIFNLTVTRAMFLYKRDFWDVARLDELHPATALGVFDFGVNSGMHESVRVLQRCLALPEDGTVGPITVAAESVRDPRTLAQQFCVERIGAYHEMPGWGDFGEGWAKRARATAQRAQSL